MPKDPKKNVDRYKIRGGDLNEFEFDKNQAALADQKPKADTQLIPGTPPEQRTEGLRPVVAKKAAKKSAKKPAKKAAKKKTTTKKAAVSKRGASAKKLAARKAAKKK